MTEYKLLSRMRSIRRVEIEDYGQVKIHWERNSGKWLCSDGTTFTNIQMRDEIISCVLHKYGIRTNAGTIVLTRHPLAE